MADKKEQMAYVPASFQWGEFGKIQNAWALHALVTSPYILSASKRVIVFVSHDHHELPLMKPLVGRWSGIQRTYNEITQMPTMTTTYEPGAEPEEAIQKAFEEIAASSSRILGSIERLNSLAEETYNELNTTKRVFSLRE